MENEMHKYLVHAQRQFGQGRIESIAVEVIARSKSEAEREVQNDESLKKNDTDLIVCGDIFQPPEIIY